MKPFAIVIFGSPGAGKSTQAQLLAQKYGLTYFDTGKFLGRYLSNPAHKSAEFKKERDTYNSGGLVSSPFVLKMVDDHIRKFASQGESLVFSGSPRTLYELTGDAKQAGFAKLLEREYGKNRVRYFKLELKESDAKKRNSKRVVCSVCGTPMLGAALNLKLKACPFCGGKLVKREDDTAKTIEKRFRVYHEQTEPIFAHIEKMGYAITPVSASPLPYKVFEKLSKEVEKLAK
jgi:adenylate kinase